MTWGRGLLAILVGGWMLPDRFAQARDLGNDLLGGQLPAQRTLGDVEALARALEGAGQ